MKFIPINNIQMKILPANKLYIEVEQIMILIHKFECHLDRYKDFFIKIDIFITHRDKPEISMNLTNFKDYIDLIKNIETSYYYTNMYIPFSHIILTFNNEDDLLLFKLLL